MRHVTVTLLLAALAFLPRAAAAQPQAGQPPATCKVVYVLDGDTINCEDGVTMRLLLVDVPDRGEFGEECRAYVVGLEPFSSHPTEGLARAVANGTALTLGPHATLRLSWSTGVLDG